MAVLKGEFYDAEGAAIVLKVRPDTIRKYVQRAILKADKQVGQSYLFSRKTLDAFNANRRGRGKPPQN